MELNYKDYQKKLGNGIMAARKEKGWSREKLALQTGGEVTTRTIDRIEKADYNKDVSLYTIDQVCSALGITIRMTLGGKP